MRRRRPLAVTSYFRRALATGEAILVVAAVAALVALSVANSSLDGVMQQWGPLWPTNESLATTMVRARSAVEEYARTGDEEALQDYREARSSFPIVMAVAEEYMSGDDMAEVRSLMQREADLFDEWTSTVAEPVIDARPDGRDRAMELATGPRSEELTTEFEEVNDQASNVLITGMYNESDRVDSAVRVTRFVVIAVIGLGAVSALDTYRRISQGLMVPLKDLQDTLRRLRPGEATRLEPQGAAEVQGVTRALNDMSAENNRLSTIQRDRLIREQQIAAAGRRIRSSLDIDEVLSTSAAVIGTTIGVDRVIVRAVGEDGTDAGGARWNAPGAPPLDADPPFETFTDRVLDQLAAGNVVTVSTRDDADVKPEGRVWLANHGIEQAVIAPVLAGSRLLAAVGLHWFDSERELDEVELATVEAICRELGMALGHARLFQSERTLVAKLQDLDQAKSDFISSVSHELRTPLTSIVGYLEMLEDRDVGGLTEEQEDVLGVIQRNTDRLQSLIEDLLTLSRMDSGRFELTHVPIDLTDIAQQVLSSFGPRIADRSQQLVTHFDESVPRVTGDPFQLERAVLNLVSNAVKFTPDGGQITVALREEDPEHVELQVSDTGMGIPAAEQEGLFTRFFRSSSAQHEAIPGTGLGLVIVKEIVERHGGTIAVTSVEGEGTTFTVRLPVTADHNVPTHSPDTTGRQA